jgi:hypothetical protein
MTNAWCFDAYCKPLHPDAPDFSSIDLEKWDVCELTRPLDLDPAGLGGIIILPERGATIPAACVPFLVAALDRGEELAWHADSPKQIAEALDGLLALVGGGNA